MRYTTITLVLLIFNCHLLFGQSILTMEYGQNFTNFRFLDESQTLNSDMQPNFNSAINLGYTYALNEGVFFSSKLGVRQAGASYVFDDFNYRWDLHYAEIKLGVGYEYGLGPVSVHFSTQGYAGYLFKAEQQLHNVQRNMLDEGTIAEWDFGVFFSPGVAYPISEKVKLNFDLNYMLGLYNIEMDEDQQTKNSLIGANIGLMFNL